MEPEKAQEISERDQLWASLRVLKPEIERIAAGEADVFQQHGEFVKLLARIILTELDFRQRSTAASEDAAP
jgi:hypothetical protein